MCEYEIEDSNEIDAVDSALKFTTKSNLRPRVFTETARSVGVKFG